MNLKIIAVAIASTVTVALAPICGNDPITNANAATSSSQQISRDSRRALHSLYAQNPTAKALGQKAKGVLLFPSIAKGGSIVGGQAGNGAMIRNNEEISGYYQTTAA